VTGTRPAVSPAAAGVRGGDPDRSRRNFALACALALAAVLAWRTDASYDTGFHLATGRWILAHRAWPKLDPFTFTVPDHPYVTMHGLFQVALALAQRAGGDAGMGVLRLALVLVAFGLTWATCRRRGVGSPALLLAGTALAVLAAEVRFSLRPELVTFACLAALLHLLARHRAERRARWLWAAVALQVVWVNGHALSPLGPAVLGLYAASGLAAPATRRDGAPWLAFAGACLALLANPYGLAGAAFAVNLATRLQPQNAFARSIVELAPTFSREFAHLKPVLAFEALLVGTALLLAADRAAPGPAEGAAAAPLPKRAAATAPRTDLFDALIALLFAALAVRAVRNIPLFAVAALPPVLAAAQGQLARVASGGTSRARPAARRGVRPGNAALVLAALLLVAWPVQQVLSGAWYVDDRQAERLGSGPEAGVLPTRTLEFIASHDLHGPVFNHVNFGGALIGRLWPGERAFIDGRLEVMGEDFYGTWRRIESGPGWADMLRRWNPNLLLVPNSEMPVLRRIADDPRWALVEWDGAAALFLRLRGTPQDSALAAAARTRRAALADPRDPYAAELPPRAPRSPWASLFGARRYPGGTWGEANALYGIRDFAAARHEYLRALREADRDYAPLLLALAAADEHCGLWNQALRAYDRVLVLDPENRVARERDNRIRESGRAG